MSRYEDFEVQSAGFAKKMGRSVAQRLCYAGENYGVHGYLGRHRSQRLTVEMCEWAEIVLVAGGKVRFDNFQWDLGKYYRRYPLGEWLRPPVQRIPDLALLKGEEFYDTVELIDRAVKAFVEEVEYGSRSLVTERYAGSGRRGEERLPVLHAGRPKPA